MSYKVRFSATGEGEALTVIDADVTVKVGAEDTGGQFELFELAGERGSGAPASRHPWAETYYVLEGAVEVQVGARRQVLTAGGCVSIPPNAVHEFVVTSDAARMLVVSLTGAGGRFFADMAANVRLSDGPQVFVPRIGEVAARHEVVLLAGAPA